MSFHRDRPQTVGQMPGCFMEKYILHRRAYEKTHSVIPGSRRLHFSVTLRVREVWDNRPPGCGVPWKIAQLGKCVRATARQAAGRVAPGSANLSLGFDLTKRRTLAPIPHGKVLFGETHKQNALFPSRYGHRMRLCVSLELQSAPFRKMCFSSPG